MRRKGEALLFMINVHRKSLIGLRQGECRALVGLSVLEVPRGMLKAILEDKGRAVETIDPDVALAVAIGRLVERRIGALVVTNDDSKVVGILSERDIVRAMCDHGASALKKSVHQAMTAKFGEENCSSSSERCKPWQRSFHPGTRST